MKTNHRVSTVRKRLSVLFLFAFLWFSYSPCLAMDALNPSGSTEFALKFARECAGSSKGNTVVSPYGAFSLLSLLVNGARGGTQSEMLKMLGASVDSLNDLNAANKAACQNLNANEKDLKLSVANAIFVDKSFSILPEFTKLATNDYFATTELADFGSPQTLTSINSWVSDKTHGCIKKILDRLMNGDSAVLLNAVYFKGRWLKTFSKNETTSEPFHLLGGTDKNVSMMHRTGQISYWAGGGMSAVQLPYVSNRQCLFVLLPDNGKSTSDLLAGLDRQTWEKMTGGMTLSTVKLSLPKFHVEYETGLNAVLGKLGMRSAFNPRLADFSALSQEKVFVSRAIQKTYMDVDEEGTEAAAVTAVVMAATAFHMPPRNPIEFKVDRPFVVGLQDLQTGEILFLGVINEP
jgi:serine protease inhibitor